MIILTSKKYTFFASCATCYAVDTNVSIVLDNETKNDGIESKAAIVTESEIYPYRISL